MRLVQILFILAVSLVLSPAVVLSADVLPTIGGSDAISNLIEVPEDLSPEDIGDFVAPLGEEQVRNLLISNLHSNALAGQQTIQEPTASLIELLKGIGNSNTPLGGGLIDLATSAGAYFSSVGGILSEIADGNGLGGFFKILFSFLAIILAAWVIESVCMRKWYKRELSISKPDRPQARYLPFKYPFYYLVVHFIGLVLFAISSYIMAKVLLPENTNSFAVLTRYIDIAIKFKFLVMLFKFIMYPQPRGLDLIDDRIDKALIEKYFIAFLVFYYVVFHGYIVTMLEYGLTKEHFVLSAIVAFGLLINPLIIGAVWLARNDIDRVLFGFSEQPNSDTTTYQFAARAKIWPTIVTVALLLVFGLWQIMTITDNRSHLVALEQAWWVIILFPLIDLVVSSLLNKLTSLPVFQNGGFQKRRSRFIFVIRNVVRLVLITILMLNILEPIGLPFLNNLGGVEKDFVAIMVDIGLIVLVGFIVWEIVLLWIEHKLPDEPEDGVVEREEGAGAAATRTETLLPLLSTTLLVVLFITVVMLVLSTLGVQIAPLLAGAGVVGIALGFGSQKLVQDILSGVFFLIDDAFRKGEYIVLAGMGGTVEKLSVRSMQLRHHRGAVQTIPYGEIQTVKNHSRDWVTMKLELRLAYDVDLEKVRKIIKKIGREMAADEEHGPHILSPLKSQGVMRVEESALIVRMKFTVVPGEQWVIRRVAYTRVRDALAAEGIEFARREVKVRLPEELENLQIKDLEQKLLPEGSDKAVAKEESSAPAALAAAAISAVVAQELSDDTGTEPVDDR